MRKGGLLLGGRRWRAKSKHGSHDIKTVNDVDDNADESISMSKAVIRERNSSDGSTVASDNWKADR